MNLLAVFLATSLLKVLMVPAYHSTDFEVHRNWLAVTSHLPWKDWYTTPTPSPWTLDYPPLFALFEYLLSFPAALVDPNMLSLTNLNYASPPAVWFQRISVIACDGLLFLALARYWKGNLFLLLTFLHPALFIVDHIHFQYNGMLFAGFVFSVCLAEEKRYVASGVVFAALLLTKHLFLYMAPAYFCFFLKHYVGWSLRRFTVLGVAVVIVAAAVLGPYGYHNRLLDITARLFPWDRGLCHAYWAPNAYVPYNIADRFLCKALKVYTDCDSRGVSLKGVLRRQETSHIHLPNITPLTTNVLVVVSMLGPFAGVLTRSTSTPTIQLLQLCALSSTSFFLFGWHVHEKAILMVVIPMGLLLGKKEFPSAISLFLPLSLVATVSVMPLVYTPLEQPFLFALVGGYGVAWAWVVPQSNTFQHPVVAYVTLGATALYVSASHTFSTQTFLPLMITSLVGCVWVVCFWVRMCGACGGGKEWPLIFLGMCAVTAAVATVYEELLRQMRSDLGV